MLKNHKPNLHEALKRSFQSKLYRTLRAALRLHLLQRRK